MLIYTSVLEKYAFNECKCNYSQEYKYLFMLLVALPIESTIFANNYFKVNISYYFELFMKLSMCCHLVTRQMEKTTLILSFIG